VVRQRDLERGVGLLLAHRLHLRAPAILISEFANTIWMKVRRGENADSGLYFHELASIPEIVDLLPDADLIERAACIAVEIGHPVYDCLYLACSEATESVVITADRRLADKAASRCQLWEALEQGLRAPDTRSAGQVNEAANRIVAACQSPSCCPPSVAP